MQSRTTMRSVFIVAAISVVLFAPSFASATPAWYTFQFTGLDIWTYSADNAGATPSAQAAPRRYRDWTQTNPIQATTYGQSGGTGSTAPALGFGAWAPGSGFAFDEINLWGKGGAGAWGEKYLSDAVVSDPGGDGVSSWAVTQSPTNWTSGIVLANQPYNTGPGAFPVWRSGTGSPLGIANMADPSMVFEFQVLISNPETAFEPDGTLRVFFGGYSDDLQGTGPNNYEVSGVMQLAPVPEPGTLALVGLGLLGVGLRRRRTVR